MWMNIRKNSLFIWSILDPIYFRITRLDHVKNKLGKPTIIRVRVTKYKGREITLADGTVIHKNDCLLKIHLHNIQLLKQIQGYDSDIRRAILVYKSVKDTLPLIADYMESRNYRDQIKALIGITMLHQGYKKLGFEKYAIYNPFYKLFKRIAHLPIYLLSNKQRAKGLPEPMYLFMSSHTLFKKHSNTH